MTRDTQDNLVSHPFRPCRTLEFRRLSPQPSIYEQAQISQRVRQSKVIVWNAPARSFLLDLPPLHLLLRQHFPSRLELFCLCPISPDAPEDPGAPSLPWRATPPQPDLLGTNHPPFYRIFLVSHKLFVDCMCDKRLSLAGESEVEAELVSELFWCEPRSQVPLDMIQ